MSLISQAVTLALATINTLAGVNVTYGRTGQTPIANVSAVPGSTLSQIAADEASMLWTRTRDYLIPAASLNFGSGAVEPAEGDTITEVDPLSGHTYTFAVLPMGAEPAWRWSDPQRSTYRIHTKLKGIA